MKLFNCIEDIAILVSNQIGRSPLKKEMTNKLFTYKSFVHPCKCVQTNEVC